jgi:hypothetical protein
MALHSFRTLLGQVPISKLDAVPRSLIDTDFVNYSIIYTKQPLKKELNTKTQNTHCK